MRTIGVIANKDKDIDFKYTALLVKSITKNGGIAKLSSYAARQIGFYDQGMDDEAVLDSSEIIIVLGGDGTFLKIARKTYMREIPILGVNLGSLGFLTEIDKNDIETAVRHILAGEYRIEERMMLEATVISDGKVMAEDVALNDVVISRGALSRILHVRTYINDIFVDSFPGDGLIISSPTGSTAYSLSAGGPIIEPDADLIIATPICPHILYSRSFITTGCKVVKAVVDESYSHDAMVTVDGQTGLQIKGGDIVEVKKSSHRAKIVRINSRNFFGILRTKIYYRGECLRKNEV